MAEKRITDLAETGALNGQEFLEVSLGSSSVVITATTISAAAADNSFNDSGSGFITAGFSVGDRVRVTGFVTGSNNLFVGIVTAVTAGKLTIGGADGDPIAVEAAGASVTIRKWISRRVSSLNASAMRQVVLSSFASVGSLAAAGFGLQTLASVVIPAGALNKNGDFLELKAGFYRGSGSRDRMTQIQITDGTNTINLNHTSTAAVRTDLYTYRAGRSSATNIVIHGENSSGAENTDVNGSNWRRRAGNIAAITFNWNAAVTINFQAQVTTGTVADNDIILGHAFAEIVRAP